MAKESVPRVYIDSCVYIDLVVKNCTPHKDSGDERWLSAHDVFNAVNEDRIQLAASPLVEAEVTCNGLVREGAESVRQMVRGWFSAPSTVWTDIDRVLARNAVDVLNKYRSLSPDPNKMRSADAIHLAAAIRMGCDFFMTHDQGFPIGHTADGVRVLRPQTVWQESLFE